MIEYRQQINIKNKQSDLPKMIRSDFALAQRAAAGDERARRQLVDRLYDRVRTTVYYLAGGHSAIEDFVQMSIVEILLYLDSYQGHSTIETWADKIAVRTTLRQIRKARRNRHFIPLENVRLPDVQSEVEERIYSQQIKQRIAFHLATLKPKHTEAITYHLVLGYTVPETAELTNTNVETMRNRLKAARKKFRKAIEDDSVLVEWSKRKGM